MKMFDVYPVFEVEPVSASGSYIYDAQGNKYLDFYGGHAVISIGHSHPHYIERVTGQLNKMGFYSNSVRINLQKELAEKLGDMSGYPGWQLFLCNSGAEANENALKLASAHNKRKKVLVFDKGFHGRTSLAVAATDNPDILFPVNEGAEVVRVPLNDTAAAEEALQGQNICAVLVEGIQGVGGIREPAAGFLRSIRQLCDDTNTVLILDEVQSGFGRTGRFFAHQYAGITPDLITVAKGMGNGFPVGGVLIHPDFEARYGMLGTTFGGNHLACTAVLAVLEVIEQEGLIEKAAKTGAWMAGQLSEIARVRKVHGRGLMIGLEFDFEIAPVRKKLIYEHRVFTGSSSNKNILRLLPPLTVSKAEAEVCINALTEVVQ